MIVTQVTHNHSNFYSLKYSGKSRRNGVLAPTGLFKLFFNKIRVSLLLGLLHDFITVNKLRYNVAPFIIQPRGCDRCLQFRHLSRNCQADAFTWKQTTLLQRQSSMRVIVIALAKIVLLLNLVNRHKPQLSVKKISDKKNLHERCQESFLCINCVAKDLKPANLSPFSYESPVKSQEYNIRNYAYTTTTKFSDARNTFAHTQGAIAKK